MAREKHLCLENPDNVATIDFMSFCPENGVRIEGATLKISLTYDKHNKTAKLHVYAQDSDDARILVDTVQQLNVTELSKEEQDEEEAGDNPGSH